MHDKRVIIKIFGTFGFLERGVVGRRLLRWLDKKLAQQKRCKGAMRDVVTTPCMERPLPRWSYPILYYAQRARPRSAIFVTTITHVCGARFQQADTSSSLFPNKKRRKPVHPLSVLPRNWTALSHTRFGIATDHQTCRKPYI
uniref:Uncharacterized protein n=1 Tax=Hyaloperonospora arabidopsidis (strain Emoy2) TaxID=559515 RepID=M4BUV5_HYAAE